MKDHYLAVRGGAAEAVDAYVPFELELQDKLESRKHRVIIYSGASAGGLKGAMWGCGIFGEESKKLFKSLKYDYVMRNSGKLQDSEYSGIEKAILALPTLIACKTKVSMNMQSQLKKYLSWEKVKKLKYINKMFITIADTHEIAKISGSDKIYSFIDIYKALKIKCRGQLEEWVNEIWIYYASDDGVYGFKKGIGFKKISDDIIPLHQAAYATFVNPLLKRMKFKLLIKGSIRKYFENKKYLNIKAFDGGIFNNEANLPFYETKFNFKQLSIRPMPDKNYPACISDRFFNLKRCREQDFYRLKPVHNGINFFGFADEQIDKMYSNRKKTNILK